MLRQKQLNFNEYTLLLESNEGKNKLSLVYRESKTGTKEVLEWLDSYPTAKSYKELLRKIKEDNRKMIPGSYAVELDSSEKTFYVFKISGMSRCDLIVKYQPENDKMYDFCRKLFTLEGTNDVIMFSTNVENRFAFLVSDYILDSIFTKNYLESTGEELFHKFKLTSKNGKVRDIIAPHDEIKRSLQSLNRLLQKVYDKRNEDFQIAYKHGKNVKTGALKHVNHKYIYNIDLHDFYPSCKKELVKRYTDFLFDYIYNREYIEDQFFDVVLQDDGLFIGSPVSGTLANAIISNAVNYMRNICNSYNIEVTVYADDITFSSDKFIAFDFVKNIFETAFAKYGILDYFSLNEKKSIGLSGCNRKVTGVSINNRDEVTIPRKYWRNIRVKIDHLAKGDQNINIQELRGKLAYATEIDESGKVARYLKKYLTTVKQYNLCSDETLAKKGVK